MKKKIIFTIFLSLVLFLGITFSSKSVKAADNEITATHVFTSQDFADCKNSPVGTTFTFELDGFVVEIMNPSKKYLEKVQESGATIASKTVITVHPRNDCKLISFEMNKNSPDSSSITGCPVTNAELSYIGTCIKYTPIDDTDKIIINITNPQYYILNFAITYSMPTVEMVTDGSFDTLAAAIEKDNIEEIIITKTIMCNRADRDFILDAKNKIIRAEITGVDESGMIQAGSTVELIHVIKNASATIKNATILGGSRSAIVNKGYLYLENVNIMRSGNYTTTNSSAGNYYAYGGIYNDETGKLVMKNCNISRNVSKYGGAIYNDEGLVILDGCSLTENRSNNRGGAIYCTAGSKLVLNNTVIANNATVTVNNSEGGAIYANQSNTYIMNSTIVGNASNYYNKDTDPSRFGGGLTIWKGNLYAVNSIITDNYAFDNGVPVESDIVSTLNNDIPNMFLYNNIYKAITTEGVTEDSSNNYQLENMSSNEEIFASYQTSGNISGDGSTNTIEFEKPILVSMPNGRVCVPTNKNCDLVENGIKTYITYTAEGKGGLFYLSYMKDGVNTTLGQAIGISENEVTTFINGEERTNSIIGSTNSTGIKYRIIKGINSNSEAGTISGVSIYGNSYEYGSLVTVTAIPNEGYEFDYWMDETGTILSSQKEYTFEALKNITITPVWISTANAGNVTVSNLTCDAVVYSNSRSIKLNNLILEVGKKIEGLYLNDTKVADENLFLLPNISGITDENGQWIATEDIVLNANIVPTLGVISTTGYSGTYDGSAHEIKVEAISPKDIVYNWYFNGSLIEGANTPALNVTNVLESGNYYCLLTSIINGEEVSVRTETIIVDITAIKVAIPTIKNDTYTYNGLEQSVEFTGIQSFMTVTGDKATNAGNYEVIISLDSNYAWGESFNGKFAWTIEKADFDLSQIKFEDLTVTYTGNKQVIEIIGALPEGVEASYTNNEGIDVNTYEATVEFVSINYNVEGIKLTSTLTIVKAQAEITVDTKDINVIYGDEIKLPEATTNFGEVVVTKSEMVNVGEYTVTYTVSGTDNYNGDSKEVKVTISPKEVVEPTVKGTYTYNKAEQTVELNGVESYMTIVSGTKGTNVDDYVIVITLDDNHEWAEGLDGKVEWSIVKAQAEITVDTKDINVIYGDEIKLPEATTNFGEVVVTKSEMVNVGEYTVTYTVSGTDNYNGDSKEVKVTISPKEVVEPTVKGTYTYNKAEQTVELNGVETFMTIESGNKGTNADDYEIIITLDDNHVWTEGLDGKVAWSIQKATHNMSGISFENVTETYTGSEYVIEITGTLPEGVTVSYTTNKGTNVGTYNAVATFTYDTANYNTITDMNAVLTINKAKVALPESTTSFVYDGTVKVALAAHDLYTVEEGQATNAGSYEAVITLKDTVNYEWAEAFNGKVAWTISKATHNMSSIKFENVTVKYDGTEHKVEITGTLPTGVTVAYTNNKGTNAGTYNAVATFTYDEDNYNTIPDMNAVLTINKDVESYVNPETNQEEVIISSDEGIDPNKKLVIEFVETNVSTENLDKFLADNQKVAAAYDIKLMQNNISVPLDGTLIIKILIPEELIGREFGVMHVHNGNETSMLEYTIEGDYVVFETNKLSEFVIVYEMESLLWLIIVLAVITVLEAGLLVFLLNKKKQAKPMKLASVYPPFVFGMFLPESHLVLVIILAIAVVALTTTDLIFVFNIYGDKTKKLLKKDSYYLNIDVEEPIVEGEATEVLDDTIDSPDEEDITIENVRIIKGFLAKLIQSEPEIKEYYDILKNELMSFKKVKSKISFKNEVFKHGKDVVAKLVFRGKTLCLYLALNPADYENTKYKIENMSGVSSGGIVPTMYRINLPRRVNYAKELIYDLMKKYDAERKDIDFINYSKQYPYEDDEALIEKGLIRKNVKIIGNGSKTITVINKVNIVKKVRASEVNNLITDEQVMNFVGQSTRIADRTKKAIINIDTISQYFDANETVTLEEIKKRVPNFDKKATYYKVLANGTLDKPLTVDADDFSIEAEKMIIVTGGKVLVSRSK